MSTPNYYYVKLFLMAVFVFSGLNVFSQEWTTSQLEVIKKYDLSEKDHRGVIFTTTKDDCDTSYASIIEAIEAYFTPVVRTDLMTVCVAGDEQSYYGRALGIREVIDIYLANTE